MESGQLSGGQVGVQEHVYESQEKPEAQGHWGSTQPCQARYHMEPFGGPWAKIIQFLPRASVPSGSREKQPLPDFVPG